MLAVARRNLHREGRELLQGLLENGPAPSVQVRSAARAADVPMQWIEIARRGIGVQIVRWRGEWHYCSGPDVTRLGHEFARPNGYWRPFLVIATIQAHLREHDTLPTSHGWKHGTQDHPSAIQVERMFGSWDNAMRKADYGAFYREWSVRSLQAFVAKHDFVPGQREWAAHNCRPGHATIRRHFGGSWNAALEAAGLEPRPRRQPRSRRPRRRWTRETIIDAIRTLHRELGRAPMSTDDHALARAALAEFGSWHDSLTAAGIADPRPAPYTRETVVSALRDFHEAHGRWPTSNEKGLRPSGTWIVAIFGSWAAAIEAASGKPYEKPKRQSVARPVIRRLVLEAGRGITKAEIITALKAEGLPASSMGTSKHLVSLCEEGVLRRERASGFRMPHVYFPANSVTDGEPTS